MYSGEAKAFGYDLLKAGRFLRDNALTYVMQEPALIDLMTVEQHISMVSRFVGDKNPNETARKTLAAYNLSKFANITAARLKE